VPSNSKIAICVSGGLRSFYRPIVHTSLLQNFVNSLEPDENKRDIFFTVSNELNCFNSKTEEGKNACGYFDGAPFTYVGEEMEDLIKKKFKPKVLDMNNPPL
jgi:hypothetical protein